MTCNKLPASFFSRVDLYAENGCWLWTGAKRGHGYGCVLDTTSHRLMYAVAIGEIPAGICVCHHCDTPACLNPHHLFLGTRSDNVQDMIRKGRGNYSRRTHCPQGHEYTPENTWWRLNNNGRPRQVCKTCNSILNKTYRTAHPHVPAAKPYRECLACGKPIPNHKNILAKYCNRRCKSVGQQKRRNAKAMGEEEGK